MFEAGTVVLIPFPFSDLSSTKKRPVLMLTPPDSRSDFMAMAITSKPQPAPALALAAGPLPLGGTLPLDSWVKTDTVFSLCDSQIVNTIGRLTEESRTYCVHHLCRTLSAT